jgi:hypothetical protein
MKHFVICILLILGAISNLHAQDKIVLRNGRTIEVHVQRSLENRVEYTYPGETPVYERPKTAISYILYEDGRKEICDSSLRETEGSSTNRSSSSGRAASSNQNPASRTSSAARNKPADDDGIAWQDVKTTFSESEVNGMIRLNRISASSNISYKDAIQQLKKKAAAIGGTTILVMDVPESENDKKIEVIGIAYRDKNMQYTPGTASEPDNAPVESSSNIRRRRIAQQMESYNNESDLQFEDYSNNAPQNTRSSSSRTAPSSSREKSPSRQTSGSDNAPDAVYLTSGRVIRGTIEEFEPDDFVSIRTSADKVYEYSMDDVQKISRGSSARNSKAVAKKPSSRNTSGYEEDDRRGNARSSSNYDDNYDNYKISGYRGTFDLGYTLPVGVGEKGRFELNTSHGYKINEYLYVGAGIGLHMYSARDTTLKNRTNNLHYVFSGSTINYDSVYSHGVDSSYMTLPLFIDIRGYLPLQNGKITPYAMLRVGYAFNLSDGFGGMGLYMNPAVGVKYQLAPMIGLNFSIGYSYQSYGDIPGKNRDGGYGFCYVKDGTTYKATAAGGFSLKLGVEF